MKPNRLLIVSILAVLAGGCASDFVTTSPDRYYYPDLHNHVITRIDGQKQGALPRNPPAIDAIRSVLESARKRLLRGAQDGTDGIDCGRVPWQRTLLLAVYPVITWLCKSG